MTRVQAIKTFMEANGGRKVENREILRLPEADRKELAEMCAAALGGKLDDPTGTPGTPAQAIAA